MCIHSGIGRAEENSTETSEVHTNLEGQDMLHNLRIKNLGRIVIGR